MLHTSIYRITHEVVLFFTRLKIPFEYHQTSSHHHHVIAPGLFLAHWPRGYFWPTVVRAQQKFMLFPHVLNPFGESHSLYQKFK